MRRYERIVKCEAAKTDRARFAGIDDKSGIQIPFRLNSSESLRNLRLIGACVAESPHRPVAPVLLRARRQQDWSGHMDVFAIAFHDIAFLDEARNLSLNLIRSLEHTSHVSLTWIGAAV
jgi:hypothetical protein